MNLDEIREKALANFEILLEYSEVNFKKVSGTEYEYDILANWRADKNFGSVRFNTYKGRGADFAGQTLTTDDFSSLGAGFSKEDFSGFSDGAQAKIGFDILGLFQRIYNQNTTLATAKVIENNLSEISKLRAIATPSFDAAIKRQAEQKEKEKKLKHFANDLWESCKFHTFSDSIGEKYLNNRGIYKQDKNVRFIPNISYRPTRESFPALIFKVQIKPDGPLVAVHRIYLSKEGTKAKVENPKMALASVKGAGIWLGEPSKVLALTEGPENALTIKELGFKFVVSSIFGTNLHNVKIPSFVKKLIIYPDVDDAGLASFERAKLIYGKLDIEVEGYLLPSFGIDNKVDINDLVRGEDNG